MEETEADFVEIIFEAEEKPKAKMPIASSDFDLLFIIFIFF